MPGVPAADRLVALAASRSPGPAGVRVVAVDGRSGSGKTTFAQHVADAVAATGADRAPVLAMDSLYPGWDGLAASVPLLVHALTGMRGGVLRHPTWDWEHDRPGPEATLAVGGWLVVEGVGCGCAPVRPHLGALAWLDAPTPVRRDRALARDGDTYAPHWARWATQEDALLAGDDVRAAADLILTTG